MLLPRFSAPGNLRELSDENLDLWSDTLSSVFNGVAELRPRFYNPTVADTPDDHRLHHVTWPAFPGTFLSQRMPADERWAKADATRDAQDEYCEWSVLRDNDGKLQRVTFTTETALYYEHLLDVAPELLEELYEAAVGRPVSASSLRDKHGMYNPRNELNLSTDGTIVHLSQGNNTLGAAVRLAGDATVLRQRNGKPVTHPQTLVRCGGLGVATRHSDPQIAAAVNNLVAAGEDVTLADPAGLYLDSLVTTDMQTPDSADASDFWRIERGGPGAAVRATFEVPVDRGYATHDLVVAGRRLAFGAQLAERLHIRLSVVSKPGDPAPARQPCVA